MITIKQIQNKEEKTTIVRNILESLTSWFEVEESRTDYIKRSADRDTFVAFDNDNPIGFLCIDETSKYTVEISVMGVKQAYHHQGIGRLLFKKAYEIAKAKGYHFIQVKTVQMGKYKEYDITNLFYQSLGFEEFEVIPLLWDEDNPCQIYVMSIN